MPTGRAVLERILVDTHLWVSLAAAGLTLFAATALQLPAGVRPAGVVFAATLLIYAVDDRVDGRVRHARSAVDPAAPLLLGSGLLAAQLWPAPALVVAIVGLGALPALLYGVPLGGRRLRDLPGVKPLFVSGALTVAAVAVPWAWTPAGLRPPATAMGPVVAALFALVLANVCVFDLRDVGPDRQQGLRTVPVLLGARGCRWLCAGLGGLVLVAAVLRPLTGAPALAAAAVAMVLCAWRLQPGSGRLTYALSVDGIPVALGVWAWAAGG